MAKTAREYVFEGMELLPTALTTFVERRLESKLGRDWQKAVRKRLNRVRTAKSGRLNWDQLALLNAMDAFWDKAFKSDFDRADHGLVNELIVVRNRLSHNESFTYSDAERALDSMKRLSVAADADDIAAKLGKMRDAILRVQFAEVARGEERRKLKTKNNISVETASGLLPWREVVEPHRDVATGEFSQAEFAADLAKVHNGSAPSDYRDPHEFFSRTYLTEGLSDLLVGAIKRLNGSGGDPVIELQTNFGGGKTHSMLALYHMAGNTNADELPGLDQLLSNNSLKLPKSISRAVIVGTSRGPADVVSVSDERDIRTTWGELAWQLGGADAFDMLAESNISGVAPGSDILEEILRKCSPALILIDEWVAYLRQIYDSSGLPSGSFDANLTFAQSLTEAVKAVPNVLFVASLPDSKIEVGGQGGKEALDRLKRTFSRVESSWRPASQEESYEIVRRRLFKEIPSEKCCHRDNTIKKFIKLYRDNSNDFPAECGDSDYRRKMESAYPIHPELFDQLYLSWGSLQEFQRTRGVLRFIAKLVHKLWMDDDPSVAIMPGSVALSTESIGPELVRYIDQNWISIIAGDVDGVTSKPYEIDRLAPNLNRYSATRRVARTIFMGTAPTHGQGNTGLDDKQINLGVVQPGERPAIFGDALRRLSDRATFIHSNLGKHWYSTSANLNRRSSELAEKYDEADVTSNIERQLQKHFGSLPRSYFSGVHLVLGDTANVPDESGSVRIVVLDISSPHHTQLRSSAEVQATAVMHSCGNAPRKYCNTLIFLAADHRKVDGLKAAQRLSMAWSKIVEDAKLLDLKQSEIAHANQKQSEAKEAFAERLKETWCYVLYPQQNSPGPDTEWTTAKIASQDDILSRVEDRLTKEQGIWPEIGPDNLNRQLEKYIWKDQDHLRLQDLVEYFNRNVYLPRIASNHVLQRAIYAAICSDEAGPFAYAQRWDGENKKYIGLIISRASEAQVVVDGESVIVRPNVAIEHCKDQIRDREQEDHQKISSSVTITSPEPQTKDSVDGVKKTRFRGVVMISPDRPIHDFGRITDAVIEQLTVLVGADVSIRLEIEAEVSGGIERSKERTLLENAEDLDFIDKSVD